MRRLVIITNPNTFSLAKQGYFYIPENHSFKAIHFSNAKSILGQEYPFAIYDMRAENGVNFNLDAFAIVAGTIQENGTLYLLCPDWENVEHLTDFDSLRWNDGKAVATPNFYRYFKALAAKYHFEVTNQCRGESHSPSNFPNTKGKCDLPLQLTTDQQNILQNLPLDRADIHLITAPRGRGKSTLAGKLANELSTQHKVLITARSTSVLPHFFEGAKRTIPFFAPDHLIEQIKHKTISPHQWLFVDEAASLPLPMLQTLCEYFGKVVLTTTTQNYEGTGRGFELKLPKMLNKPFKHWALSQALRWGKDDSLEQFINELLLLDENLVGANCNSPLQSANESKQVIQQKIEFYHLLANAHYKTTPTDLRRLFDGGQQILYPKYQDNQLIGGIWAVNEGNLDENLTQAIWQGKRRPQGNLVAQYLCFQSNLPQACRLRSVRISRIAVKPEWQNQGIGKRLISDFILQNADKKPPLDFISVSFGLTAPLYRFWQACGFRLVQITPNKEASSGYRSAMMIYPISKQGTEFCNDAEKAFNRNFALQPFFSEICADLQNFSLFQPLAELNLNDEDWQNLQGFVEQQRTLSAVYVSLKRLYYSDTHTFAFLHNLFEQENADNLQQPKSWVENCRKMLQERLDFKNH